MENNAGAQQSTNAEHKTLVVYFSRTGENYTVGTINTGNTAQNDQAATQQVVSDWLGGMDFFG